MVAFLADECFSGPIFRALVAEGFDVQRSVDSAPAASDEQVLDLALRQGRVLLTEDNDFGDLTVRLGFPTLGVVRIDLKLLPKADQVHRVVASLQQLDTAVLGALVTIEPTRTRVRLLDELRKLKR
jgi:predicted nuclease of predicted toxin-antitoxin system